MLESLEADSRLSAHHLTLPLIDADGRIKLPGFPQGLTVEAYLTLVNLHTRIVEASRVLDRYRSRLRLPLSIPRTDHPDEAEAPSSGRNGLHREPRSERGKPWGNGSGQCHHESGLLDQFPLTALHPSSLMPHLYYKREDQTVTRAYKVRGAVVGMAKAMESGHARQFLAVSTGNHALGVLKAAELLRPESVRIVVPDNTTFWKVQRIMNALANLNAQGVQADLVAAGQDFDQARAWALNQDKGEFYLDPYEDPWVVAGQGTLGLELAGQIGRLLETGRYREVVVVSPIGGGGLLAGTSTALRMASAWEPAWRSVTLNLVGLTLGDYHAELGDAIRVKCMAASNRAILDAWKVDIQAMGNEQMAEGLRFTGADLKQRVEGASAGTLWPVLKHDDFKPNAGRLVVSLLSGANTSTGS